MTALVGLLWLSAACTAHDEPLAGASTTPSMVVPAPDAETTAPAPDADYQAAIEDFCAAAGDIRSDLQTIAASGAAAAADLASAADEFHDAFAALYAAHQTQFGNVLNGSEPLDSGFAVDAALTIMVSQQQSAGGVVLAPTDPVFDQIADVAAGCSAQGAPMP